MSNSTQDAAKRKVLLNLPLSWTDWNLSEQAKALRFVEDEEGNIWAYPIVIAGSSPSGTKINLATVGSYADDLTNTATTALHVRALQYVYNNVNSQLERVRTPTKWKYLTIANIAGLYDVWTPAAGKKFRLMGGLITILAGAAAAANISLAFSEETTGAIGLKLYSYLPIAASIGTVATVIPFDFGNGYLAVLADKKLQVTTDLGVTAGQIGVQVWGTEE